MSRIEPVATDAPAVFDPNVLWLITPILAAVRSGIADRTECHPVEWSIPNRVGNTPGKPIGYQPVEKWRSDQPLNTRRSEAPRVFKPSGLYASA